MGTLQDIVSFVGKTFSVSRKRYVYRKPQWLLHYSILAATIIAIIVGSMTLLNLFEPFGLFGRIMNVFVRPVTIAINNSLAFIFSRFGIYTFYQIPLVWASIGVIFGTTVLLGLIGYWSVKHGRMFCNTLCPVGAMLGLLSKISLFKIVIDLETCKDCGLCEKVCKAGCIDADSKKVDFENCIGCFNCFEACPTVGLKYQGLMMRIPDKSTQQFDPKRREIIINSLVMIAGVVGSTTVAVNKDTSNLSTKPRQLNPVSPPGSKGIGRLSDYCTACHLCITICPTQVIQPSFLEYGVHGIFMPKMDYSVSYCTYECNICTNICPSGALLPLALDQKKTVQLGKAQFVKDDCIVISQKKDCAACSEHCPTKAVKTIPYEGKLFLPEVHNEICVGCGACEHACPVKPRKAIYVESNPVHLVAQKPPQPKTPKPREQEMKEFPF
jgi:ferredoxin